MKRWHHVMLHIAATHLLLVSHGVGQADVTSVKYSEELSTEDVPT
jgi:hypothetical protein